MAGALQIADYIYVLNEGQLVASGSPQQLIQGHSELVTRFIEASGIHAQQLVQHRPADATVSFK